LNESAIDYFRRRERAERNAAELATCDAARRAHEELATAYSKRLSESVCDDRPFGKAARDQGSAGDRQARHFP
jgi:hypothetical protein